MKTTLRRVGATLLLTTAATCTPLTLQPTPALAATTGTSPSRAHVTLSMGDNLDPAGQTITVTGTGFSGKNHGYYLAVGPGGHGLPSNGTDISQFDGDRAVWVRNVGAPGSPAMNTDGTFSATITLGATFGSTNCLTTTCSLWVFGAHGVVDSSEVVEVPISFTGGVAAAHSWPEGSWLWFVGKWKEFVDATLKNLRPLFEFLGVIRPENTALNLQPETTTGIHSGQTLHITGQGYAPGAALYIAQTIARPEAGYPQTYGNAVKVVADEHGTFQTDLTVESSFAGVDCGTTQCFIASFNAFPRLMDRSSDRWVPITFGASTPAGAPTGAVSSSGARVTLSKTTGLNPAGDTIHIDGTGFKTEGNGIYVGIAQQNKFSTTQSENFGPSTMWVSRKNGRLSPDGTFSIDLPVSATWAGSDCMSNSCAVYTFAAHGSPDRSQDTATPVSFEGGIQAATVDTAAMAAGSATPANTGIDLTSPKNVSVKLSTTALAPSGETQVTVSGAGFKTTGNGIYVGIAQTDKFSTVDASVFGATNWVRPEQLAAGNGTFTTTLKINPVFEGGNCIEHECAIYTFAAHGSSDRSQDTMTLVTVTGSQEEKEKALAEAAKAQQEAEEKKAARKAARQNAQQQAQTTPAGREVNLNPILIATALILGIGLGAAVMALIMTRRARRAGSTPQATQESGQDS